MYYTNNPSRKKAFTYTNLLKKIIICIFIIIVVLLLKKFDLPLSNKILSKMNHYIFVVNYDLKDVTRFANKALDLKKSIPVFSKAKGTQMIIPVENGKIVSDFGLRMHPILKVEKKHKGIDIAQKEGAPVKAVMDGEIIHTGKNKELGNFIKIKHSKELITVYAHLRDIYVKKGEKIRQGSVIGTVGNSGLSESYHLHFEVIKNNVHQDPKEWLKNIPFEFKVDSNGI